MGRNHRHQQERRPPRRNGEGINKLGGSSGGMFANWEGKGGERGWSSTGGRKKKQNSDEIPLSEIGSIRVNRYTEGKAFRGHR